MKERVRRGLPQPLSEIKEQAHKLLPGRDPLDGVVGFATQDPWLAASIVLFSSGMGLFGMVVCLTYPWIPLFAASAACLAVAVLLRCRRAWHHGGLKEVLPSSVVRALQQPVFDLIIGVVSFVTFYACNVMRVLMLAGMELDEAQRREILEGCDRDFRQKVFMVPLVELLPAPVERLFNSRAPVQGGDSASKAPSDKPKVPKVPKMSKMPPHSGSSAPFSMPSVDGILDAMSRMEGTPRRRSVNPSSARDDVMARALTPRDDPRASVQRYVLSPRPPEEHAVPSTGCSTDSQTAVMRSQTPNSALMRSPRRGLSADSLRSPRRGLSVENMLDMIQGMEGASRASQAQATADTLERIMAEKAANRAATVAKSLVVETYQYGKAKTVDLAEGVRETFSDPKVKVATASAVGGAVTVGASGAATGLISGGVIGAAIGVVPAIFTFGLSIPIGAALGGGTGLVTGATVAGTAGLIGGGAAGYGIYSLREERSAAAALKNSPEDRGEEAK